MSDVIWLKLPSQKELLVFPVKDHTMPGQEQSSIDYDVTAQLMRSKRIDTESS